jgi:hypothetical protein
MQSEARRRSASCGGWSWQRRTPWDSALVEFMASCELFPTRAALDNVALSLRSLKRYEIDVQADQPGSTVVVDGQQRGATPLTAPVLVNAGTHSVRVSHEGFDAFETQLPVAGKQRKTVQIKLRRLAHRGTLLVREAGGQVLADEVRLRDGKDGQRRARRRVSEPGRARPGRRSSALEDDRVAGHQAGAE